ncbi:MAG: alcohol dehydrogenase [Thermoleophilia bacterium]|nr:alcohol dehydrogenase [Thermoleophilia bacterium]
MPTQTNTMRAAVLVDEGDPETALAVRDEPLPEPGVGEVRIRVSHASLNHLDVWIRKGLPSVPKPRITGADACGTVDAFGPGAEATLVVRGLAAGARVVVDPGASCGACRACATGETSLCPDFRVLGEHVSGTHAGAVVVPAICVHPAPAHLDDAQAAAFMLTFATTWRMLFTRAQVRPDERVLVWGASSGVGTAALALCRASGIETIATTRTEDKVAELRELGADHVIVTGTGEDSGDIVVAAVERLTGGDGVDVAFDHLGKVAWEPSMLALRRGGRYVTCGASTGPMPRAFITRLFWKQLSMLGSTIASRGDVEALLAFMTRHEIAPRVDTVFDLDDIAQAHRHLESGTQVGKVVIRVAG